MPFATTYAVFASRRAYDFICMAIAEENLDVKIVCALPGLTTGYGPSHQATEDLAIFRGMPNLTIVDPCDALDIEQAVPAIAAHKGPVYMRLLRGNVPLVLDKYDYQLRTRQGEAPRRRLGRAVHLERAHDHAGARGRQAPGGRQRRRRGAACADHQAARHGRRSWPKPGASGRLVVVAENHTVVGGLGEAVAGLLMRNGVSVPFRQIAPAGRVPRRRRAADAARPLRAVDDRDRKKRKRVAVGDSGGA